MGFQCEIPMGFPCYFSYFYDLSDGISVRFLWDFDVVSMINSMGIEINVKVTSNGISK